MTESGFREWLKERGVDGEAIDSIVSDSNKIQEIYAEQVRVGAALDHETWLDDLTSSVRGDHFHQVIWVLSGMTAALFAFLET